MHCTVSLADWAAARQVVTTNYKARERGVKKLTGIDEALEQCPELVLIPGEDLTPYREASKAIFRVLSSVGEASERLGMDEVWVDVTERCRRAVQAEAAGADPYKSLGVPAPAGSARLAWECHVHTSALGVQSESRHRVMDLRALCSGAGAGAGEEQIAYVEQF